MGREEKGQFLRKCALRRLSAGKHAFKEIRRCMKDVMRLIYVIPYVKARADVGRH